MAWAFKRERSKHDRVWLYIYVAVQVLAPAGSIVAWIYRHRLFCHVFGSSSANDSLGSPGGPSPDDIDSDDVMRFMRMAWPWILLSTLISSLLAAVLVVAFEYIPYVLTFGCAYGSVLSVPAVTFLKTYPGSGNLTPFYAALAAAAPVLVILLFFTRQLLLATKLLKQAARCLGASGGLLPTILGFTLVKVVHLLPHAAIVFWVHSSDGEEAPGPSMAGPTATLSLAESYPDQDVGGQLEFLGGSLSSATKQLQCHTWEVQILAKTVVTVAMAVPIVWTMSLYSELRLFTIAGTVAQWYIRKDTPGRTLTAAHYGIKYSLGSLCCSSAIVSVCKAIQALAEEEKNEEDGNNQCNLCCVARRCIVNLVECCAEIVMAITEFTTVQMAITGESFFAAARNITELLQNHMMDAAGMWYLPGRILNFATIVLTGLWGLGNYHIARNRLDAIDRENAQWEARAFGAITGGLAWVLVSYVAGVLQSACIALFVCFAFDKDHGACLDPAVHDAVLALPTATGKKAKRPSSTRPPGAVRFPMPSAPPPPMMMHVQEPLLPSGTSSAPIV